MNPESREGLSRTLQSVADTSPVCLSFATCRVSIGRLEQDLFTCQNKAPCKQQAVCWIDTDYCNLWNDQNKAPCKQQAMCGSAECLAFCPSTE